MQTGPGNFNWLDSPDPISFHKLPSTEDPENYPLPAYVSIFVHERVVRHVHIWSVGQMIQKGWPPIPKGMLFHTLIVTGSFSKLMLNP